MCCCPPASVLYLASQVPGVFAVILRNPTNPPLMIRCQNGSRLGLSLSRALTVSILIAMNNTISATYIVDGECITVALFGKY